MAEYSAIAVQTVNPGESAVYTATTVPCNAGVIQHGDGTPNFLLSGYVPNNGGCCCCNRQNQRAEYDMYVGVNIAIPTGGTVGQIAIAVAVDGATLGYSEMDVTPAAVEQYFHVSNKITVPIFRGCCQTVTVRNISDQPILMKNLVTGFKRDDL